MKIAYIEWLDARGERGPLSRKDAEEEGSLIVTSAGILVREDAEVVTIAMDYWSWPDRDGTIPETVREIEVIPRVLVRRLAIIEVPETLLEAPSPPEEGIAGADKWQQC